MHLFPFYPKKKKKKRNIFKEKKKKEKRIECWGGGDGGGEEGSNGDFDLELFSGSANKSVDRIVFLLGIQAKRRDRLRVEGSKAAGGETNRERKKDIPTPSNCPMESNGNS